MKKVIESNYLIKVKELVKEDQVYYFWDGKHYFFFVPCFFSEEEIITKIELLKVYDEGMQKQFHYLVPNIYGKYLTENYVLMMIQGCLEIDYGIKDIILFNKHVNGLEKYAQDWTNLWSNKIDYFEYQVREKGLEKKEIISSFSYYIGLAENAITYLDKLKIQFPSLDAELYSICHRRVNYPNYKLNFFNPLSLIVDLRIRDFCEYLKNKFFVSDFNWQRDIDEYFSLNKISEQECHLFYARMLFPSYYFDCYERIINENRGEEELDKYILKIDDYEKFLGELKKYLQKYTQIFDIEWLSN